MWTNTSRIAIVAAAVLAAACGGGGGGETPVTTTYVKISAPNQDTVAHAAIASILPFVSLPTLEIAPSPARVIATEARGSPAVGPGGLTGLALRAVSAAPAKSAAAGVVRPLTQYQDLQPCSVSGSMTVTWDDRDENRDLSAGDTISVAFNQCKESPDSSVNGNLGMSFDSIAISPSTTSLRGSMSLRQLAMVDLEASLTMDGDLSYYIYENAVANGTNSLSAYTIASGGLKMAASGTAVGYADTLSYRAGYTVTQEEFMPNLPGAMGNSTLRATGDFGSANLGGDLSLSTQQPFKLTEPDNYPAEGQLFATGDSSTRLSLTAMNSAQVRMDVCDDGDGQWEGTKTVDWSWLMQ